MSEEGTREGDYSKTLDCIKRVHLQRPEYRAQTSRA